MANNAYKSQTIKNFSGEFEVVIQHKSNNGVINMTPVVQDGVKWETDRQGSPGKLTCTILANNKLEFQEGDVLYLRFKDSREGWVVAFYGYIFTKKRNKSGWIDVTAYDLLRYLKNKATMVYENKRASDIVKMIANDYHLSIGRIESTKYVIGERVEDDQTLFDIIQNALDLTVEGTSENKLYVLYADRNRIHLRSAEALQLDVVINKNTAEDFDYSSSIDDETYNEVELYYDNDTSNQREYYRAFDSNNMNNWGRLRFTQSVQTPSNINERVKNTLRLYNRKKRELKVKGAFGDYRCRAGASVIVDLDLGDIKLSNYMLIEKATHTFKHGEYTMDLTLSGSWGDIANEDGIVNQVEEADVRKLKINITGNNGSITAVYYNVNNVQVEVKNQKKSFEIECYKNSTVKLYINPESERYTYKTRFSPIINDWKRHGDIWSRSMDSKTTKVIFVEWEEVKQAVKQNVTNKVDIPLDSLGTDVFFNLNVTLNGVSCCIPNTEYEIVRDYNIKNYARQNIKKGSAFIYNNQVFIRGSFPQVLSDVIKIYWTNNTKDLIDEIQKALR